MGMGAARKKVFIDIGVAISLLYVAVWVYEIGNFLALSLSSAQVSISYSFLLPVGTSAMTAGSAVSPFAKLGQVAVCSSFALAALYGTRRLGLFGSQTASVCVMSVFLATFYWEALSLLSFFSYATHIAVFVTFAAILEIAIFSRLGFSSRPSR